MIVICIPNYTYLYQERDLVSMETHHTFYILEIWSLGQ